MMGLLFKQTSNMNETFEKRRSQVEACGRQLFIPRSSNSGGAGVEVCGGQSVSKITLFKKRSIREWKKGILGLFTTSIPLVSVRVPSCTRVPFIIQQALTGITDLN